MHPVQTSLRLRKPFADYPCLARRRWSVSALPQAGNGLRGGERAAGGLRCPELRTLAQRPPSHISKTVSPTIHVGPPADDISSRPASIAEHVGVWNLRHPQPQGQRIRVPELMGAPQF